LPVITRLRPESAFSMSAFFLHRPFSRYERIHKRPFDHAKRPEFGSFWSIADACNRPAPSLPLYYFSFMQVTRVCGNPESPYFFHVFIPLVNPGIPPHIRFLIVFCRRVFLSFLLSHPIPQEGVDSCTLLIPAPSTPAPCLNLTTWYFDQLPVAPFPFSQTFESAADFAVTRGFPEGSFPPFVRSSALEIKYLSTSFPFCRHASFRAALCR